MGQSYMHGDEQANRVGELISDVIYSARQSGIPIEKIIIGIVGELHGLTDELNQTIQMHNEQINQPVTRVESETK